MPNVKLTQARTQSFFAIRTTFVNPAGKDLRLDQDNVNRDKINAAMQR